MGGGCTANLKRRGHVRNGDIGVACMASFLGEGMMTGVGHSYDVCTVSQGPCWSHHINCHISF